MSGRDDVEDRRRYKQPYTHHNTIPTIQKYREEKDKRREQAGNIDEGHGQDGEAISRQRTAQRYWHSNDQDDDNEDTEGEEAGRQQDATDGADQEVHAGTDTPQDTSQVDPSSINPKARMKAKKKHKSERMEREVTDPVTHLPVRIFDFTEEALEEISENEPPHGSTPETYTGCRAKAKGDEQLRTEMDYMRKGQKGMNQQFPPPAFVEIRKDLEGIEKKAFTIGLIGVGVLVLTVLVLERLLVRQDHSFFRRSITWTVLGLTALGGLWAVATGVRHWLGKRVSSVWDDEVWDADRGKLEADSSQHDAESVRWLNSLLGSVWPLINPDLFTSLADTLEDVMQASLPRLVRMVSVEDVGQGSEPIRILGVRWLPTAAAARSVGEDGKLRKTSDGGHNDRTVPGEGQVEEDVAQSDDKSKEQSGKDQAQAVAEGMEAEDGDFINLEVAFAYRARSKNKSAASRMKDMHLYLAFVSLNRMTSMVSEAIC